MVSTVGVAVAVTAMVAVMSVFNGFHSLIEKRMSILDPPLLLQPIAGKAIANADSIANAIEQLPSVAEAFPIIEERGLAISGPRQTSVRLIGVPEQFYPRFDSITIAGEPWQPYHPTASPAVASVGVANALLTPIGTEQTVGIYLPKRIGRINPANPMAAFRTDSVAITAAFAINQLEYDSDVLFVPLHTMRQLLQYTHEATSIYINPHPSSPHTSAQIAPLITGKAKIITRSQLLSGTFQIVNIERWITFALLAFILAIASFNIITSLSLLIIEKQTNAQTLTALGATPADVRQIYLLCGLITTAVGTAAGLITGTVITLLQQHLGIIKLTGDTAAMSIRAYPCVFNPLDLIPITLIAMTVGLVTSWIATRK